MVICDLRAIRIAAAAVAVAVVTLAVAAAAPLQVALVEAVSAASAGVEPMDYVETGKVIALGPDDTLVLSYMSSCVQETVTGGTVTVGTTQSEVRSGRVKRIKVQCDAGKMLLGGERETTLAGSLLRGELRNAPNAPPMLYGSSPLLELKAPGVLVIERVDKAGERYVVDVARDHLLHGRFYDFARLGKPLRAGGVYRAVFGAQTIVFQIDAHAEPGYMPIMSRLLRFSLPS
jgi:hypothetical protein